MGDWERIQNLLRTEEPVTVQRLTQLCAGDLKIGEIESLLFQMARGGQAHRKEETRNNRSTEFWYYGKEEQSSMPSNAEINAILRETKIKTPPKRLPPGWKFDRALLPNYVAFNYAKNLRTKGFSSKLLAICNAHDLEAERNGTPILRDDAAPEVGVGTPFPTVFPQAELERMREYHAGDAIAEEKPVKICYVLEQPHVITGSVSSGKDGTIEIEAWPILPIENVGEENAKTYADALAEYEAALRLTDYRDVVIDYQNVRVNCGSKGKPRWWVMVGPEMKFTREGDQVEACRDCGCTQDHCQKCVEKTGSPCWWVEPGLCSACSASASVEPESAAPSQAKAGGEIAKPAKLEQGKNGNHEKNGSPGNSRIQLEEIPMDKTIPWVDGQVRTYFDHAKLDELAESIREKGVLQPILVRPRAYTNENPNLGAVGEVKIVGYEIIAGERRWRAARIAGLETIPAIIRDLDDKAALEVQVIENLQRADLREMEEAFGYQRLIKEYDYTPDQIAEKVSKSKAYIYGRLKLCNLPAPAVQAMNRGELPATIGELIGRLPSDQLREQLWENNFEGIGDQFFEMPTFRDIKAVIESSYMRELKGAPFSQADMKLLPEAGSCKLCPKRTGNNRIEYPDGRADVCTDPGCFKQKVEAHNQRQVEKLEKQGATVIDGGEAAKLFTGTYDGGKYYLKSDAEKKYVELDKLVYDHSYKSRSVEDLVGGEIQPVVLIDPNGTPHKVLPVSEVRDAIHEKGFKLPGERSGSDDSRRQQEKERKAKETRQKTAAEICALVVDDLMTPGTSDPFSDETFLRLIARSLIEQGDADIARLLGKRREIKLDPNQVRGSVAPIVDELKREELRALIAEYFVARELTSWIPWGGDGRKFPLTKYFDLDPKAIEKRIAQESREAEKAKKAAKKAKAKKPSAGKEATR